MGRLALTARGPAGAVADWRRTEKGRMLLQLLLIAGISGVAALGKRLEPSLGIPGSSAPLWLGALVAGRAIVQRKGAGIAMGLGVAFWGIPLGLNNAFVYNLALYGCAGVALDVVSFLHWGNPRGLLGALVGAISAHMVKFGFILGAAYTASVTKHFLVFGIARSALLHFAFGAAAGAVGWGVYKLWNCRRTTG